MGECSRHCETKKSSYNNHMYNVAVQPPSFLSTVEPCLMANSVTRSPRYYGHFVLWAIHFLIKKLLLMWSPVNMANGHVLKSQTIESLIISPPKYSHLFEFYKNNFYFLNCLWHVNFIDLVLWACSCTVFRLQYT